MMNPASKKKELAIFEYMLVIQLDPSTWLLPLSLASQPGAHTRISFFCRNAAANSDVQVPPND